MEPENNWLSWEQQKEEALRRASLRPANELAQAINDFQCWVDAMPPDAITRASFAAPDPWANLTPFDLAWLKDLEVGIGDTEAI